MKHFFRVVFAFAIVSMSLTANSQVVYPFNADGEAELSEVVECSLPKEIVYKNALDLAAKKWFITKLLRCSYEYLKS